MQILIEKTLKGYQLDTFINYLQMYCTKFSIQRDYYEWLDFKEFKDIQHEFKEYIIRKNIERRLDYEDKTSAYRLRLKSLLGIKSDEEAYDYFDDWFKQDQESLYESSYKELLLQNHVPIKITNKDFLYQKVTRVTTLSVGGYYCVCYFKIGDLFDNTIRKNGMFF